MIAHLIGYLMVLIVLSLVREAIHDGCRDRVLAWMLCIALIVAVLVLWVLT